MQNDFIDGALGTPQAVSITDKAKDKIKQYKDNGDLVVFTMDTHSHDYLSTQEGVNLPIIHCVKDTHGWQLHPQLDSEGCKIYQKGGFGSIELANHLATLKDIKSIQLIGICTDICVINNAMILKAAMPEVNISVDSSCCAGTTPDNHINALNAMKLCQIEII